VAVDETIKSGIKIVYVHARNAILNGLNPKMNRTLPPLNYEFVAGDAFSRGTYSIIIKQEGGSDAALFGIGQYASTSIITLMDKTNFVLNAKAVLNLVGPPSSKLSIAVLDSNDNVKITDSITTSSVGKSKYVIDLDDLYHSQTVSPLCENVTQRTRDCCSIASHDMGRRADFYPEISKHSRASRLFNQMIPNTSIP